MEKVKQIHVLIREGGDKHQWLGFAVEAGSCEEAAQIIGGKLEAIFVTFYISDLEKDARWTETKNAIYTPGSRIFQRKSVPNDAGAEIVFLPGEEKTAFGIFEIISVPLISLEKNPK